MLFANRVYGANCCSSQLRHHQRYLRHRCVSAGAAADAAAAASLRCDAAVELVRALGAFLLAMRQQQLPSNIH